MKKKIIVSVLAVLIVVSGCVGIAINSKSNDDSLSNKADLSTKSNLTTTVHTTNETTTKSAETTTEKATTTKSTTQKSSSSQKQSNSSGSSKSNGNNQEQTTKKSTTTTKKQATTKAKSNNNSQKRTTKKSTTTTKKQTTTKAKSYAMTKAEIRNYALNEIKKIDGTIYESEMSKDNSGWYSPLIIEPGDSEAYIKEAIRDSISFYNGTTKNGYNVYVENSTYWYATESYDGECREYNIPCIKVYFLYGQRYTGPPIIEAE